MVWFRAQNTYCNTLTWNTLKKNLELAFKPMNYARKVGNDLESCLLTEKIAGYNSTFDRVLCQCIDILGTKALHRVRSWPTFMGQNA